MNMNPRQTSGRTRTSLLDIVRVGGRYRVGKLLGAGASGEFNSDSSLTHFLISLGSVYLGKDIMTGADVALKIARRCSFPSRLSHEYNVYTAIAGSRGICQALWYGKEDAYEIIVLDQLETSLSDQINQLKFDHRKIFSYATQMVRCIKKKLSY